VADHDVAPTTHTPEMQQLVELNAHLAAGGQAVTAAQLGVAGASLDQQRFGDAGPDELLPGPAVLVRLEPEGPPDFPYIHGQFRTAPGQKGEPPSVILHTAALRELSNILGLRHRWGTGGRND
jgi:hypothetical protein